MGLGDPVLASAVLDRIAHCFTLISLRRESFRPRERRGPGTLAPVLPLGSRTARAGHHAARKNEV
jgi:hypothetical protein